MPEYWVIVGRDGPFGGLLQVGVIEKERFDVAKLSESAAANMRRPIPAIVIFFLCA